jgi:ribosome-associated translation inhibitor RaiA
MRCEIKLGKNLSSDPVREHFAKQLKELSPRFDRIVRHLIISAKDINGPRGGLDKECIIFAYLNSGKSVRISARSSDLYQAVDLVVEKAKVRLASLKVYAISQRRPVLRNQGPEQFA